MHCTSSIDNISIDTELESDIANIAKAFSHPARVRIIRILSQLNGCMTSDLVNELNLAQSTVSEHLRILRQAKLVIAQVQAPKTCYRINAEQLQRFYQQLEYTQI
ncbi:ArsR family transcriptional regulator [Alginatibacterium sediminis]|uniref:ArsR family transcriptional regulator n=1 Tax=Alginatibacterium sediminis TaxID=2164068 RepID=A0A420E619_9ALTE|nr:metalloregulator ArsR/SmtB family transcription factor [Alginatibacterium sediminis]RKF12831.1 ArsR family transcriptional regulator [Alginatibacterium sediminis]